MAHPLTRLEDMRMPRGPTPMQRLLAMRSPRDVQRALRAACAAGALASATILLGSLYSAILFGPTMSSLFLVFMASLMLALVYGMSQFSRAASLGLLVLFVGTLMLAVTSPATPQAVIISSVALWFVFLLVRGVQATFMHRLLLREFSMWQRTMHSSMDPRLFEED